MAKANAVTGTTLYVPQGAAVPGPGELAEGVRLVGPGAPVSQEEGEQPSPGPSSSASTSKPQSSDEPSSASHPKPARTTGRRSSRDQAESSGASGTGGSGPETT